MSQPVIHRIRLGFTQCYLIPAAEGYLLVDTSLATHSRLFENLLARMDIEVEEIRWLLLTHHHDDHAGFAAELRRRSGCRLIVHRAGLTDLAAGRNREPLIAASAGRSLLLKFIRFCSGTHPYPPIHPGDEDLIMEGKTMSLPPETGLEGRLVHTPGHTADSLSLILADGSALVGDAAINLPWIPGASHLPLWAEDAQEVVRSWETLKRHGATLIFPGHGKPFPADELAV